MSKGITKGYTINYFLGLFGNVRNRNLKNLDKVYSSVSPRFGFKSIRAMVLDQLLDYNTSYIFHGVGKFSTYGKTPRARLLKALRNRKTNGVA